MGPHARILGPSQIRAQEIVYKGKEVIHRRLMLAKTRDWCDSRRAPGELSPLHSTLFDGITLKNGSIERGGVF
jgi:hypothetical protein